MGMGGMDMGLGAMFQGINNIFSSVQSAAQARMADNRARKAASKARNFYERMRATQYQTTVKDMEAAGLNPVLAATGMGGAGAAMPAAANVGRTGSSVAPVDIAGTMQRWVSSAKKAKAMNDELETIANVKEKSKWDARQSEVAAAYAPMLADSTRDNIDSQTDRNFRDSMLMDAQKEQTNVNTRLLSYDEAARRNLSEFYTTDYGKGLQYLQRFSEALQGVAPITNAIRGPRNTTVNKTFNYPRR